MDARLSTGRSGAETQGVGRRPLDEEETRYMQGDRQPVTSSVLISSSKYLNDPVYRDTFAQFFLRRYGRDLAPTYMIPAAAKAVSSMTDPQQAQRLIDAEKEKNPEFKAFLDARADHRLPLDHLDEFEEGTFGAALRALVRTPGMKLDFMYAGEAANELDYIAKRLLASHDIGHIVTGFGTNMVGEGALANCVITAHARYFSPELATYLNHMNMWVASALLVRMTLHYPAVTPTLLDGVRQGIAVGQALPKPIMMIDWAQYADRQLDDIACEFGFVRGPGDAWNWTTEAAMG